MALGDKSWWGYSRPNIIYRINTLIIIIFAPSLVISQIVYLYVNFNDLTFDTLGIIFSIVPVTCLGNVNVYSARMSYYKTLMREFMSKIHLNNGANTNDPYLNKKIITIERVTRFTAYYLIFFFSMNWVTWIWIPVFNNMRNMEAIENRTMRLQTCLYFWVSFDYSYDYKNWFWMHLINAYVVAMGVAVMMIFHTLNYIFMYHLIGHIQILKQKIRTECYTKNDGETKKTLIDLLKYHAFIIRVFKNVQSAFGINVAANYMHNLVSDSLIMYQVMYGGKENILLYVGMVAAYMGGLILMSFVLEEIRRQTDDLADVVYSVPWEEMCISNQKTFILFLQRVQPPMEFTALGGLRAGVKPLLNIIKTTFSYYVMLETTMAAKS